MRAFPEQERATASAILAVPVAVALGPILGGYFVAYHSWHWVFLINIPIGSPYCSRSGSCRITVKRRVPASTGLTHSYAKLLAGFSITANAIAPALIETDMVK